MIDANDLMLGDWVMVKKCKNDDVKDYPIAIHSDNIIDIIAENLIVEPIPITTEFLERNGFIDPSYSKKVKYELHEPDLQITYYPQYSVISIWKKGENPVIVRQNGFYKAYNEVV